MGWENNFEVEYIKNSGAEESEIELFIKSWNEDLSEEEVLEINSRQKNTFNKSSEYYEKYKAFDPLLWNIPKRKLPDSYIEFLKYSNGGEFGNGDRYLQFFSTYELREMNLEYELPEYMESAISFAMDGCGNHLLFDMRKSCETGEYPILASHSGSLGCESFKFIANSFIELCMGKTSID